MRAGLCVACLGAVIGFGCAKAAPRRSEPAPSAAPDAPESSARALVAGVLASVRSRLSLAAPAWELQPFAFGRHELVWLGDEGVQALAIPEQSTVFERRLEGARAAVELAGGSVLVLGATEAWRVDPGAKAPVRLPAVPWLPGTLLLPERRDSNFVWAVERAGRSLVRQRLALDPTRSFDRAITLEGYEGGAVAALRDGALLYRASDGIRRALPEGHPRTYASALEPWRLLPARRIDEAWAVAADGSVERWQLGERLAVVLRFTAGAPPFAAAANADYLALVVVDETAGSPRRFRLLVWDETGARVCALELPPGPPETGENWAEQAVRDRQVALSESDPVVAVGGPGALEVFRLPGGERLLTR